MRPGRPRVQRLDACAATGDERRAGRARPGRSRRRDLGSRWRPKLRSTREQVQDRKARCPLSSWRAGAPDRWIGRQWTWRMEGRRGFDSWQGLRVGGGRKTDSVSGHLGSRKDGQRARKVGAGGTGLELKLNRRPLCLKRCSLDHLQLARDTPKLVHLKTALVLESGFQQESGFPGVVVAAVVV